MPEFTGDQIFDQKMPVLGDSSIKHLAPYQRILLADLYRGDIISWTFAPHNIKPALWDLIYNKKLCILNSRRVGDDPREYEFVILSKKGRDYMVQE